MLVARGRKKSSFLQRRGKERFYGWFTDAIAVRWCFRLSVATATAICSGGDGSFVTRLWLGCYLFQSVWLFRWSNTTVYGTTCRSLPVFLSVWLSFLPTRSARSLSVTRLESLRLIWNVWFIEHSKWCIREALTGFLEQNLIFCVFINLIYCSFKFCFRVISTFLKMFLILLYSLGLHYSKWILHF